MIETAFHLEIDEFGWPPAGAEWLWLETKGNYYIVRSAPLFLSGLAVDDEIELCEWNSQDQVTKWRLVVPSDRSVVWVADLGGSRFDEILAQFRELGCNTETLSQFKHAAVDIPADVSRADIDVIVDPLDPEKYAVAFPCDRQQ